MKEVKAEPYRIKTVERLQKVSLEERIQSLKEAGYNPFKINSSSVYIDLISDVGLSAMSDDQWSGLMIGDEAYAGSRNFYNLLNIFKEVFGFKYMIPTHSLRGAENLACRVLADKGSVALSDFGSLTLIEHCKRLGIKLINVAKEIIKDPFSLEDFKGDLDVEKIKKYIREYEIKFLHLKLCGHLKASQPTSIENLKETKEILEEQNIPLILDASQVMENSYFVKLREEGYSEKSLEEIAKETVRLADVLLFSAREDGHANVGALIGVNDLELYLKFSSLVTVFEGLFTYGGLNGRDLEAIVRGLKGMYNEEEIFWRFEQIKRLAKGLRSIGFSIYEPYGSAIFILASEHLRGYRNPSLSLSNQLFLSSGIRTSFMPCYINPFGIELQGIFIPRRVYTNTHLDYVLEAFRILKENILRIPDYVQIKNYDYMSLFNSEYAPLSSLELIDFEIRLRPKPMPYRIKTIESMKLLDLEERKKRIKEAGYNTFLLRSEDVYIDLLTDSGTSAQSSDQWQALMRGDESFSGKRNFNSLLNAVRDVLGYKYVIPTHQGRAAEHILSQTLIRPGTYVPMNMYFTTTREHIELAGGIFYDVIIDEAYDTTIYHPFKGNVDLKKLEKLINEVGPEKISYASIAPTVNMAAGQPISMENIRKVYYLLKEYKIPLILDATRIAENAYFIKIREKGYEEKSLKDIIKEFASYSDGCTMSGKKDLLGNIGGFIAINDENLYERMKSIATLYEGNITDGGMSGRDMEALAMGIYEMTDFEYISSRIEQTQYLGDLLIKQKVPIYEPVGSHAVCLDAKRFLKHLSPNEYPAQALAAAIYQISGVRTMERGTVSAGRDKVTGEERHAKLELVRLTIPRRVYTNSHMEYVAEKISELFELRDKVSGLRIVYEPKYLRFFSARFEPINGELME